MVIKKKSMKINAVLNTIKSALSILFPIITFPYASRILQAENLGKVNYSQSIITYFTLIAGLGISTYAIRQGAKIRDDREQISRFVSEVFTTNIVTTIFSYLLLVIFVLILPQFNQYRLLLWLLSLNIIFSTLGVEWINTIYEDYFYITIRSIVVQIISLLSLFLFVKSKEDFYKYAAITVFSNGIVCVLNILHCRKNVDIRIKTRFDVFSHIKPALVFFSNKIAVNIYVSSDTTMIGWFNGDLYVGLYSAAVKVYHVAKQLLAAIYVVTIPRLSKYAAENNIDEYRCLITRISSYLILLILPASTGMFFLSDSIILLISGEKYSQASLALKILSVALVFAIPSGVLVNCINTPLGREKVSLKATSISAIINIGLNFFMVPFFKQNGAAITTVISEVFVTLYCVFSMKNFKDYFDMQSFLKQLYCGIVGSIIVTVFCFIANYTISNCIFAIMVSMMASVGFYGLFLAVVRNSYFIDVLRMLKHKRKVL